MLEKGKGLRGYGPVGSHSLSGMEQGRLSGKGRGGGEMGYKDRELGYEIKQSSKTTALSRSTP